MNVYSKLILFKAHVLIMFVGNYLVEHDYTLFKPNSSKTQTTCDGNTFPANLSSQ